MRMDAMISEMLLDFLNESGYTVGTQALIYEEYGDPNIKSTVVLLGPGQDRRVWCILTPQIKDGRVLVGGDIIGAGQVRTYTPAIARFWFKLPVDDPEFFPRLVAHLDHYYFRCFGKD